MTWNNDVVLEFVDLYRREQIIWDHKHPSYRNKAEVGEAWLRIQNDLSTRYTVMELKRKKESLMTSFRMHLSKKRIREGYTPTWFAFNALESFLGGKYECDSTVTQMENEYHRGSTSTTIPESGLRKRRTTENRQNKTLKNESSYSYPREQNFADTGPHYNDDSGLKDECELYGLLLAKKLRRLNEHQRDVAMHEIDNIMFRAKMQSSSQGKSYPTSPPVSEKVQSPIFVVTHQSNVQYEDENIPYEDQLQDPS